MKITWIGHACVKVESKGNTIILDPYNDGAVPGLSPVREQADVVLCSHEHGDHSGRSCVTLTGKTADHLSVEVIDTYHDEVKGAKRGPNKIHIISDGDSKIAHMGDIGCELEPEQKEMLKNLDVLLIPVGGFFTIDAAQAAAMVKELTPKYAIPMHFRDDETKVGYDIIGTVTPFVEQLGGALKSKNACFDTETGEAAQVIVLKPQNH